MILRDETTGESKDFGVNKEDYARAATEIERLTDKGHIVTGEAVDKVTQYYGTSFKYR